MSLNDPVYQRVWGSESAVENFGTDVYRQRVYANLIISYWERDYTIGDVPERALRGYLAAFFHGEAGRMWWVETRNARLTLAKNRKARRFAKIVDQEYRKAAASGSATVPAMPAAGAKSRPDKLGNRVTAGVVVTSAAIGGAVIAAAIRRLPTGR
jgi:hypothetical protein